MVTFDFDDTLTLPQMSASSGFWTATLVPNEKTLARLLELHAQGHEVRIVTTRSWSAEVFDFVRKHDLPVAEVHFTDGELKGELLQAIGSDLHFDDSTEEASNNRSLGVKTVLVVHPWDRGHNPDIHEFDHFDG